jgi:hypothetical protein
MRGLSAVDGYLQQDVSANSELIGYTNLRSHVVNRSLTFKHWGLAPGAVTVTRMMVMTERITLKQ